MDLIFLYDKKLFMLINKSLSNGLFDVIFPLITNVRFWIIPGTIAIFLFTKKEGIKAFYILGLSIILVTVTDPLCVRVLKPWFGRLRPCHPDAMIKGARFLIGERASYSFPSAHAMNIFAQATLFSFFYTEKRLYFFIFAGLIGYSRIYVGVHYPLDIFFGAIWGIACGIVLFSADCWFISPKWKFLKRNPSTAKLKSCNPY